MSDLDTPSNAACCEVEHEQDCQAQCDALTHELHEVRTRSEQTQRTLEDALLERSIEVAELRARQQQADQKLFSQRASFPASNDTDKRMRPEKSSLSDS